ncbi:Actin cross-linking toxin VgrG1 [Pedobacter sp. Bi27]|uniref:type VI secretion system Vgr family protein n=1 Tax=unclassified Pedobacter TaxID=2628915 RepID=UPI001E032A10|nr:MULTISPECIES: phage baseplate assembly protein V [unclassified Pedobacter]CAH0123702.1 Actin cross-linking toxin VgrG1 [Pedobacter sp. Bi36]CAH0175621.1 Actin cross-linking toxin VgrG1 [Pedobacter sp. Bi126]CAH0285226.1 Actin cross-linking toxin VgrG1 [Pedobacter sp. Bi27]
MERKLITEINIEDKAIPHFDSFDLEQQFNGHHYFELRFKQNHFGLPSLINLDDSRDFVGKTLTASFGYQVNGLQEFAGLVTKIELAQNHGYHGILIVSGYSPTILIDRGPDLGSYLDKDLNEIVALATKDTSANDLKIICNASRKKTVDYLIQYKESDFEFLNRLSGEYHEWFFYDGKQLNFGKPDEQKEVVLFYGRDVQNLQYAMEISPIKHKRFAYNPKEDEMLHSESTGITNDILDLAHAIQASNRTYSKTFNQPSLIRVENSNDIKSHVENEEKATISELLKISATGDNAELSIGNIAEITMSVRQGNAFITESIGKFLITNIHHHIDVAGKYQNTFTGLTAATERILVENYKKPNPDILLADVMDNNDPEGQGRIKVKFKWECLTNDITEWLRVIAPDAGSSEQVNTNRGFVFIPEVGDQVAVTFEEGNIARPIVLGSVFHGINGAGGYENNHLKAIATRSGHLLEFNDAAGAETITITDKNRNIIRFDTSTSSIEISAPENISIRAKNIDINAEQNISISAGEHIYNNAGGNISSNAGENHSLMAENITMIANDSINKTAIHIEKTAEQINLNSTQENIEFHSAKEIVNKSGSKVKLF